MLAKRAGQVRSKWLVRSIANGWSSANRIALTGQLFPIIFRIIIDRFLIKAMAASHCFSEEDIQRIAQISRDYNTPTSIGKTQSVHRYAVGCRKHPHGRGEDNSALYGILCSAMHSMGYSPHIDFVHSGSPCRLSMTWPICIKKPCVLIWPLL